MKKQAFAKGPHKIIYLTYEVASYAQQRRGKTKSKGVSASRWQLFTNTLDFIAMNSILEGCTTVR